MPVITLLSASFCREKSIISKLKDSLYYPHINDSGIIEKTAGLSGISSKRIESTLNGEQSVFNKFSHEKEKVIACLKLVLSDIIKNENIIIEGKAGQLLNSKISHVLTICITANLNYRLQVAAEENLNEKDARKLIEINDSNLAAWFREIRDISDPWDSSLYDILLPADKTDEDELIRIIKESKAVLKPTTKSMMAKEDFQLAAKVEWELIGKGHFVDVNSKDGNVKLVINKNVLMLGKLEKELKDIVKKISGVKSVKTKVGKEFYKTDIYMPYDFEAPKKVLLVDDERDFVQTLSERLLLRDVGSVYVYDGESALDLIEKEEPEVMILDLRMPKIDGIEVLKHIKQSGRKVEVIILTGHGSEEDRKICLDLGAFAYLQKPVNIDLLSETMKKAYKKLREENKNNK